MTSERRTPTNLSTDKTVQRDDENDEEKASPGYQHHVGEEEQIGIKFSAEEEASLLQESNSHKVRANDLFIRSEYTDALGAYEEALSTCPNYLDFEWAVLKSNMAACYIKLQNWKEATNVASIALERLKKLQGLSEKKQEVETSTKTTVTKRDNEDEADEEIISAGAVKAGDTTRDKAKRKSDIEKIWIKTLLRRARANCELGGWSALQSAMEDYKVLSQIPNLSTADRNMVQRQLNVLPHQTKAAQDKEIGDLMGQLKNIGNGLLKPFGLSTNNFQMQKDEKTGSYSLNFNQNSGEK